MTEPNLIQIIERECERTSNSPDLYVNAQLGLTFRAVWWPELRNLLKTAEQRGYRRGFTAADNNPRQPESMGR